MPSLWYRAGFLIAVAGGGGCERTALSFCVCKHFPRSHVGRLVCRLPLLLLVRRPFLAHLFAPRRRCIVGGGTLCDAPRRPANDWGTNDHGRLICSSALFAKKDEWAASCSASSTRRHEQAVSIGVCGARAGRRRRGPRCPCIDASWRRPDRCGWTRRPRDRLPFALTAVAGVIIGQQPHLFERVPLKSPSQLLLRRRGRWRSARVTTAG
jgi:hypothetical protein